MIENPQKINIKELIGLIILGIGIALVSSIIFSGLNLNPQANVADAISFLDVSERVQRPLAAIDFVFETSQKFLDETYIATQQLFVMQGEYIETANKVANNFLQYSESLASNYSKQSSVERDYVFEVVMAFDEQREGRVAGKTIETPINALRITDSNSSIRNLPSNNDQILQEIKNLLNHARLSF